RSTNTGVSAFIDHRGRVLSQTRQFETESLTASLQGRTGATPFYYFAKVQGGLAVLPFVVVLILARRKAG
ncbi:MAG: apolipoprotein N-acyltransferase, partial [Gammaproteobacteria bacterium]